LKGFYLLIDEFNTVILANLLAWRMKQENPNLLLATVCDPDYMVLFSHFDKLLFLSREQTNDTPVDQLAKNCLDRNSKLESAISLMQENNIEILNFGDLSHLVVHESEEGVHKTVLVNSISYLLSEGVMIKSSKQDKNLARNFLQESQISKTHVLVIGRNRTILPQYNNTLLLPILKNLVLRRSVINATFPNPNLPLRRVFKNYFELPTTLSGYGVTVALMEDARETIVIGNAGGVGVHMMTGARIRVVGLMNWVNGVQFNVEGLTLYSARKLVGLETIHTWVGERPRNILQAALKHLKTKILAILPL
jgi:hypothetical protein